MGSKKARELMRLLPRSKYEEFFQEADTNNDGFISYRDLKKICVKYNYLGPDDQLTRCFREANADDNDKLSFQEYMLAMGFDREDLDMKGMKTALLRQIFSLFDKDGNGTIDGEELDQVFKELGKYASKDDVSKMIAVADKDGSGSLDYDEFIQVLTKEGLARP